LGRRAVSLGLIALGTFLVALAAGHYVVGLVAQERAPARPGRPARLDRPSPGEPIARVRIPRIHLDAVVLEGTSAAVLRLGPGHMPGTGMPGARNGYNNCVIAGHRDSFFRRLGGVRTGDRLYLDVGDEERAYRVVRRRIVPPSDVAVAGPTRRPRVTLITCYPFHWIGRAPYRFILEAEPTTFRRPSMSSASNSTAPKSELPEAVLSR
jgi:sortase A